MSQNVPEIPAVRYFLGANSPQGFISRFDQLDYHDEDWHTFIIKGGPGCGKSTFLNRIADEFAQRSPNMELIPCSSDAHSLDAVILPEWKASIVDGTAPHVLEATYPAINQSIISLGDFLNPLILKGHGETIRVLSETSSKNYTQAVDFLSAARAFLSDSYRIELGSVDIPKLSAYVQRFAAKAFPRLEKAKNKSAVEKIRFLSSISCDGFTLFQDTPTILCEKIYFIEDDCGAVSSLFLNAMRSRAIELGYDVTACYCSLYPHNKIDHLLIPQAGIAFLTENHYHKLDAITPDRRIHAKRFLDHDKMHLRKRRLSYNQKAAAQLLDQAVGILRENKALHDQMEALYQNAMDFSRIDELLYKTVQDILNFRTLREQVA